MQNQSDNKRIDGKSLAETIKNDLKQKVYEMKKKYNTIPCLAVILVGTRADSSTYVRMKKQACLDIGINFILKEFSDTISQNELLTEVLTLNNDESVHGLIVQLPLPSHINEKIILNTVSLEKDIDGFHPLNIGHLCMKGHEPYYLPCTPKGCMAILDKLNIDLCGKHVVIIGRSNIVGIPVAMLCLKKDATITICHSKTQNIMEEVKRGDIVIAAVGKAKMIKKDWIKEGAVVIDVGINSIEDASRKSGYRLVGDVDYQKVKDVASKITQVPGGVGPMTVISLLENTYKSACRFIDE